ncbi:hypothetical protein THAOC_30874, partial [Thalassiosira oceanica]
TALHFAASSGTDPSDRSVIERLVDLHPSSASRADGGGRTPLHLACAGRRSWDDGGVGSVFAADPSAALVADGSGMLPLHAAAMRGKAEGGGGTGGRTPPAVPPGGRGGRRARRRRRAGVEGGHRGGRGDVQPPTGRSRAPYRSDWRTFRRG